MEEIHLNRDKNDNFLLDITSMLYILSKGYIKTGATIYMIEKDGQTTEYFVGEEYLSTYEKNYCLYLSEEKGEQSYLELDGYALAAKFLVLEYDVTLDDKRKNKYEYVPIHYEEAMTRLKKGRSVYLKIDEETYIRKVQKDELTAEMVMDGKWHRKEKVEDKEYNSKKTPSPFIYPPFAAKEIPLPSKRPEFTLSPKPGYSLTQKRIDEMDRLVKEFLNIDDAEEQSIKADIQADELFELLGFSSIQPVADGNLLDELTDKNLHDIIMSVLSEVLQDIGISSNSVVSYEMEKEDMEKLVEEYYDEGILKLTKTNKGIEYEIDFDSMFDDIDWSDDYI